MRAFACLAAPLLLVAAPALAQGDTPAPACTAGNARATSIAALTADPAAALGDCVTVEGTRSGLILLADSDARYRPVRVYNDPSSSGAAIGLIAEPTRDTVPQRVRITGRVTSCEQQAERLRARDAANAAAGGDATISILGGYCHWHHGLVLQVSAVEQIGPAPLLRRPAGDNPQGLGNLAPLAAGPARAAMQAAAQRLLDAIRAGDAATIRTLHGGPPLHRSADELAAIEQLLLRDAAAPFAALRGDAPVTIALFGWKPPLWADDAWRAQAAADGADAIACYSTRADAAALWPIDSRDADNRPGRPYACTAIHLPAAAGEASFDTQQAHDGAQEPG